MNSTKPPIPSTLITDEWIADFRQAANQREGVPFRASPTAPSIEVWSINRSAWLVQMLPGGGTTFESAAERDAVMHRLRSA